MSSQTSGSYAKSDSASGLNFTPAPGAKATARPRLLKPEQAQQELQVGKTTLFSLIKSGEIQSVRIGRARRIVASSLDAFIDQRLADTQ